jgi:hypothetical protein
MKRDLYEKRLLIYRGVVGVTVVVLALSRMRSEDFVTWAQVTAEKDFLLDAALCEYLETFRKQFVELWAASTQLSEGNVPVGDQRAKLADRQ